MKTLEELIRANRAGFDHAEPSPGHEDRFFVKLSQRQHKGKAFRISFFLKVAATFVLICISGIWIYERLDNLSNRSERSGLRQISPEYREVEIYFTSLVNTRVEQINSLDFSEDSTAKEMLLKELVEMDAVYDSLSNELKQYPTDQRIIDAMISHYEMKVEILNRILDQLKNVKSANPANTTRYENPKI